MAVMVKHQGPSHPGASLLAPKRGAARDGGVRPKRAREEHFRCHTGLQPGASASRGDSVQESLFGGRTWGSACVTCLEAQASPTAGAEIARAEFKVQHCLKCEGGFWGVEEGHKKGCY